MSRILSQDEFAALRSVYNLVTNKNSPTIQTVLNLITTIDFLIEEMSKASEQLEKSAQPFDSAAVRLSNAVQFKTTG